MDTCPKNYSKSFQTELISAPLCPTISSYTRPYKTRVHRYCQGLGVWGSRIFMCKTTRSVWVCSFVEIHSSPAECKVGHAECARSYKLSQGSYKHTATLISWDAVSYTIGKCQSTSLFYGLLSHVDSITHNQTLLATLSGIHFWYWLCPGKYLNTIRKNTGDNLKKWDARDRILY